MKTTFTSASWARKVWLILPVLALLVSCNPDDLSAPAMATDELSLTASSTELALSPADYQGKLTFNWTTGNNQGTGASINYVLELDKAANDFSNPISYELGRNIYTYSINLATFNQIALTTFGGQPGEAIPMQARIIANFGENVIERQISVLDFSITPYLPLTTQLYIVGSATPNGWNIGSATAMIQSTTNPYEFVYNGQLSNGNFKFPVNTDSCWCQDFYTKDPDDEGKMVHNIGGSGADLQWEITAPGSYRITVDVFALTISIEAVDAPPFTQLWIVGDASPSGWDINTPDAFTVTSDPFVFTYEASLTPGNFKILAGSTGDWCGQWYRPLVDNESITSTTVAQNSGCDVDNKWQVTAANAGRYKITLNTASNTIHITPVDVYMIGDATPNGWNMGSLTPMSKNGSIYTWTGTLNAGEFKFTKFNTNWCDGTEIVAASANQSITNTAFNFRDNCSGDDNKWVVTAAQAGTHTVTLNLDTNELSIQ